MVLAWQAPPNAGEQYQSYKAQGIPGRYCSTGVGRLALWQRPWEQA